MSFKHPTFAGNTTIFSTNMIFLFPLFVLEFIATFVTIPKFFADTTVLMKMQAFGISTFSITLPTNEITGFNYTGSSATSTAVIIASMICRLMETLITGVTVPSVS